MGSARRSKKAPLTPEQWQRLPDESVLQLRVRDLGLQIPGSPLEACVQQLYAELTDRGIRFHPPCYLADEWFTPDKIPTVAIPFCLAHPRLIRIEEDMMLEVEGGTPESCMKLLRHECGHALNYAYCLYRRTRWRELFGPFSTRYSSVYAFQPYSRRFVAHLGNNYAQAHPDEDFAETFAVWLTPGGRWEETYHDWPAMAKLRYVDAVMHRVGDAMPVCLSDERPWSADRMTSTLAAFYERKRKVLGQEFAGYFDDTLQRIFVPREAQGNGQKAARLLRRYGPRIVGSVAAWTGQRKYDVNELVRKLAKRCDDLDLYAPLSETDTLVEVTAVISAVAGHTLRQTDGKRST